MMEMAHLQWAVAEDILEFLNTDSMLQIDETNTIRHLIEKYDLEDDKDLFKKVSSMK